MVVQSPWQAPEIPETDLTSFVLRHAERLAGQPALIDGPSGRALTYGALAAGVERVAGGLVGRGFGRGDVLALHLPNLPEFPLALHGALRAGGIVTCASPLYTAHELADQVRKARPRFIVSVGPLAETARAAAGDVEVLELGELLAGGPGEPPAEHPDPGDVALMLPSSGTTGLPKLVELSHRALVANLVQMRLPFPAYEGGRLLGLAPFFHSMGLQCVLHRGLDGGAAVVSLPRFDLEVTLRAMHDHRVDQALVAPPLVAAFARHPVIEQFDLSALALLGSGGAPLDPELERAAAARLGCTVASGLGITEAGPLVSCPAFAEPERVRVGTCGQLIPGTEAQVVGGELWIRSPSVFSGYRDDPAATAATIDADGWLHTGDLAEIDADGYVTLTGRLKELIKVSGFQVAPAELEAVLMGHPAIADACVAGVPDERSGERPKAWVVVSGPFDAGDLYEYVEERVAPYKKLVAIEPIDELPRSMTGKLLRRVLIERERTEVAMAP
ncbi:MAG TPA: AMP-binding protein [Solirubrobacteraceae bacterium]|nr:AMP-binding protein [Solirubrobacteraceae bacterium]